MNLTANSDMLPFDFVLFGGTGDLSMRKLLPALYYRDLEGQMPEDGRIICAARSDYDTAGFLAQMEAEARPHVEAEHLDQAVWQRFRDRIIYVPIDVTNRDDYAPLAELLKGREDRVRVFYLSVTPKLFGVICDEVAAAGLVTPTSRVALEKPLGRDLASAIEINDRLALNFEESQIFRIDHYLGKETVQNLMALRFGNAIFEPLWRNERISDVQITIAENLGVEGRAGYYDHTGALRDMVQNHLLQLLVIIAMEPPVSIHPDAVRDEKIKVLRALKDLSGQDVLENTVRGQYKAGAYADGPVPAYTDDPEVPDDSLTETFVALKTEIGSWRWEGVPFFLRSGKRMESKSTEIVINFKKVPYSLFDTADGQHAPNQMVIQLQPEESIRMRIYVKTWGDEMHLQPVYLNLDFNDIFQKRRLIAYERLLMDIIRGDPTLFMRRDEVEAAWAWIDPIISAWEHYQVKPKLYTAGTWGPAASTTLLSRDDVAWYED